MIWLTDAELTAITDAARPLPPKLRDEFLRAVASELDQHRQRGPGAIYRACRDLRSQIGNAATAQDDGLVRLRQN